MTLATMTLLIRTDIPVSEMVIRAIAEALPEVMNKVIVNMQVIAGNQFTYQLSE